MTSLLHRSLQPLLVCVLGAFTVLCVSSTALASYPPQIAPPSGPLPHMVSNRARSTQGLLFSNDHNYGSINIHVDVSDNYLGDFTKYQWVYKVTNFTYDPVPGMSNGFSGFELALPAFVPDIANITAPDGIPPWTINCCSGQPVEWDLPNALDTVGGGTMPGQTETYSFSTLPRLVTLSTGWFHTWISGSQQAIVNYPADDAPEVPDVLAQPNQELCCTHDALGNYTCQVLPAGQCDAIGGTVVVNCNDCPPITATPHKSWGAIKRVYYR